MDIHALVVSANLQQLIAFESGQQSHELDLSQKDSSGKTPLFYAIKAGNEQAVHWLLYKGAKLELGGDTPFAVACYFGHQSLAQLFYQPSDVNATDTYGNTPFMHAARAGQTHILKWLLEMGADINHKNHDGDGALSFALQQNHQQAAQYLMSLPAIDLHYANVMSYSPFMFAVYHGLLDIAEQINQAKPQNLDALYTENNSLLHICAMAGKTDSVEWLLARGANHQQQNRQGRMPIHLAAVKGHLDCLITLLEQIPKARRSKSLYRSLMIGSVVGNHTDDVQYLLSYNKRYSILFTNFVMLQAISKGNWSIAKMMLALEPKAKDKIINFQYHNYGKDWYINNTTMLHQAIKQGRTEIAKELVKYGANIKQKDDLGNTPLHAAVESGNSALVKWLCHLKLDINVQNKQKQTALHMAVQANQIEIAKCLILHGASIDVKDKNKQKPLALINKDREHYLQLTKIAAGDLSALTLPDLHLAAIAREDKGLLQCLPNSKNIDLSCDYAITPLELAANYGRSINVAILLLWRAQGDRSAACQLVNLFQQGFDVKSKAYQTIGQSLKQIEQFPENRLQAIQAYFARKQAKSIEQPLAEQPEEREASSNSLSYTP